MERAQQVARLLPLLRKLDDKYTDFWSGIQGLSLEKRIGGVFMPVVQFKRQQLAGLRKEARELVLLARTTLLTGSGQQMHPPQLSELRDRFAKIDRTIKHGSSAAGDLSTFLHLLRDNADIRLLIPHAIAFWRENLRAHRTAVSEIPHQRYVSQLVDLEREIEQLEKRCAAIQRLAAEGAEREAVEREIFNQTKAVQYLGGKITRASKKYGGAED